MDYAAIGKRIRYMRKTMRLTQEKFAEMIGISTAFIGHIERGTRVMSMETLLSVARALGCSTDYILDHSPFASDDYMLALLRVEEFVQNEMRIAREK